GEPEQSGRCLGRCLILGPEAQDGGDQDLKGIAARCFGDNAHDRFLPATDLALEDPDAGVDVVVFHNGSAACAARRRERSDSGGTLTRTCAWPATSGAGAGLRAPCSFASGSVSRRSGGV